MSLLRKQSLNQMKNLYKKIGKDIGEQTEKSSNVPNIDYIRNPFKTSNITVIDDHIKLENVVKFKDFSIVNETIFTGEFDYKRILNFFSGTIYNYLQIKLSNNEIALVSKFDRNKFNNVYFVDNKGKKYKYENIIKVEPLEYPGEKSLLKLENKSEENIEDKIIFINNFIEISDIESSTNILDYINNLVYSSNEELIDEFKSSTLLDGLNLIYKIFGENEIKKIYKKVNNILNDVSNESTDIDIINRNIKKISDWNYDNKVYLKERPIIIGYQVNIGNDSGTVQRITGNKVYIQLNSTGKEKEFTLKELIKNYIPKKEKEIINNISLNGPANISITNHTKEEKSTSSKILNEKPSEKIKDKNWVEMDLKLKKFGE
jgi:hypothetical protein